MHFSQPLATSAIATITISVLAAARKIIKIIKLVHHHWRHSNLRSNFLFHLCFSFILLARDWPDGPN